MAYKDLLALDVLTALDQTNDYLFIDDVSTNYLKQISVATLRALMDNCAFLVTPSVNQLNLASGADQQINFGTEIFDEGNDFAANQFVAPVDGRYRLKFIVRIDTLQIAANYYYMKLQTSNRNYLIYLDPNFLAVLTNGYSFALSILADMDVGDTAKVYFYQNGGAAAADMMAVDTWFSGFLVTQV